MAASRIPGPLQHDCPTSQPGCHSGALPGPGPRTIEHRVASLASVDSGNGPPATGIPTPFSELDLEVANAGAFDFTAKHRAEAGVRLLAIRLIRAGTVLYRVGSTLKHGKPLPQGANFASPWWMRGEEFDRLLAKGQQDTSWAARVLPAIASAWGTECDLQVRVTCTVALYAWVGEGKPISFAGAAVEATDPGAHWFPEEGLLQLFIPGLDEKGAASEWQTAFGDRTLEPWLPIGTQRNLATGRQFIPTADSRSSLPPGRR